MSSRISKAAVTSVSGSRRMVFATKKLELEKRMQLLKLQHQFEDDLDELQGLIDEEQLRPAGKKRDEAVAKLELDRKRLERKFDKNKKQVEEKFALLLEKAILQEEDNAGGKPGAAGGNNAAGKPGAGSGINATGKLGGGGANYAGNKPGAAGNNAASKPGGGDTGGSGDGGGTSGGNGGGADNENAGENADFVQDLCLSLPSKNLKVKTTDRKTGEEEEYNNRPSEDDGTRLGGNTDLSCKSHWIRGPEYLKLDETAWPCASCDENGVRVAAAATAFEESVSQDRERYGKGMMKEKFPKDQTLLTALKAVDNVVNSRPLAYVSSDPGDPACLTPNHFLRGIGVASSEVTSQAAMSSSQYFGDGVTSDREKYGKMWEKAQLFARKYWDRWSKEVPPDLHMRNKWNARREAIRVGDIVLMVDDQKTENEWSKAMVTKRCPAKDGSTRKAERKEAWRKSVLPDFELVIWKLIVPKSGGRKCYGLMRRIAWLGKDSHKKNVSLLGILDSPCKK